jgi:uncharacterized protein YkwD
MCRAVTNPRLQNTLGALLGGLLLAGMLVLQPIPVASAGGDRGADIARVLQLTNAERQTRGLAPLALSSKLSDAALNYSQVLASGTCFEHTCGEVPNFADRISQAGYTGWTTIAENIAYGYPTADAVVAGWMGSAGHRANMLSPTFSELGVGVVTDGSSGTSYWTQEFGNRPGATLDAPPAAAPDDATAATSAGDDDPQTAQ